MILNIELIIVFVNRDYFVNLFDLDCLIVAGVCLYCKIFLFLIFCFDILFSLFKYILI